MKKIALCLSGYFDSLTDKTSNGIDGFNYIKKKIFPKNKNNIDIFIHSWDLKNQDIIKNLYSPKDFIFEKQKDFSKKELDFYKDVHWDRTLDVNRLLSIAYSVSKSIELCSNTGIYDIVIRTRFDLGRINRNYSGIPFITFNPFSINRNFWRNRYPVQCINFNTSLDMNYYYFAEWNKNEEGPADMWWYSSQKNMNKFIKFYDFANRELSLGSKFISKFEKPNYIFLLKHFMIQQDIWKKKKDLKTVWE
jgi:hypothetical protein